MRGHTLARLKTSQLSITHNQILFRIGNEKSTHVRTGAPPRTIKYYRTQYNGKVFQLLQRYQRLVQPTTTKDFFCLANDPPKLPVTFLNTSTQTLLQHLQHQAPGRSGHSLRHTFASMTRSINVSLEKVCYVGGWSIAGTAIHTYVDPTYPSHPISALLFNGLLPPASRLSVTPRTLLGH